MTTFYDMAWTGIVTSFDLNKEIADKWFSKLMNRLTESDRHYHTYKHVKECITTYYKMGFSRNDDLELACWFHDAVYDPKASDNEEKSVEFFREFATEAKLPQSTVDTVVEMIMATKTHKSTNPAVNVFLDLDLAVLGSNEDDFSEYNENIRQEYSWVAADQYSVSRKAVMQGFLDRKRIYRTDEFFKKFEKQARQNLVGLVKSL